MFGFSQFSSIEILIRTSRILTDSDSLKIRSRKQIY